MRVALAQLNYHIGNFASNTEKIISSVNEAKKQEADVVVFGELAVCGYPPRDFLEFNDFIDQCLNAVQNIANASTGITTVVGAPARNPRVEGKNLFNAAYVVRDGKIQSVHYKALLPTYDVFDEYRYFEPAREFQITEIAGKKVAVTICEDIWDIEEDKLYTVWPMEELKKQGAELMINIAASPFNYRHADVRRKVMQKNTELYQMPLVYVQHCGAQTELIFDGGSMVVSSKGHVAAQLPFFEEALTIVDLNTAETATTSPTLPEKSELIHQALVCGIRDYFKKMNFSKAILGLSGGVDSALVLALACDALGKDNVLPVLLPSQYSSDHSVNDSIHMCENIGCRHEIVPIEKGYNAVMEMLQPSFANLPFNVAEENIQARMRAIILMGMANKHGYILLNTTNKSEAAVGYGTLYGDMCGGLSVLGDVYKTEVYALCRWINRNGEIIPENILTKAPSAELRPNQKDSDSLPEYDILDKILYAYIEERKGPRELYAMGFEEALVNRVLKMVNSNEWKRAQMAPVLRVSPKAFGSGRRMPIVGKYLS
jgi:NAD+ synthase (glutamine-hydrolysing)